MEPSIQPLLSALRHNPRLALAFLAATAVALFFAVRLVIGFFAWDPPPDEEIRPWMTVGYIARSWDLDPRAIDALAGLPVPEDRPSGPRPYTLREIAEERGVPDEDIVALVADAVAELRARGAVAAPAALAAPRAPPPPATSPAAPVPPP